MKRTKKIIIIFNNTILWPAHISSQATNDLAGSAFFVGFKALRGNDFFNGPQLSENYHLICFAFLFAAQPRNRLWRNSNVSVLRAFWRWHLEGVIKIPSMVWVWWRRLRISWDWLDRRRSDRCCWAVNFARHDLLLGRTIPVAITGRSLSFRKSYWGKKVVRKILSILLIL